MRRYLRNRLPDQNSLQKHRWLRPFARWFQPEHFWHLNRHSVSGGVAVGLFCGLIPGPFQMLGAAIGVVIFRVNLPVALFTTLYTNPFTIVPLYLLAFELGDAVVGSWPGADSRLFSLPDWASEFGLNALVSQGVDFGIALIAGLFLLASTLAFSGYFMVRLLWYGNTLRKWRKRRRERQISG